MPKMNRSLLLAAGLSFALTGAAAAETPNLPKTMVWTAYDVGSSGYNEASAIADALAKKEGLRVRLLPSGTSIGRVLPMLTKKANYGFLATEVYFAIEGTYEFAARDWGPQDLRVLLGRPASVGFATAKDAGVKTLADLKGKRVAYVTANPSVNVKADAFLAFAGLTEADIKKTVFPNYGASLRALVDGNVDAAVTVPTAAILRELEASSRGIHWPEFDPANKAGWDRIAEIAPYFSQMKETIGAGIDKDKGTSLMSYRYPMMTAYASIPADEVYAVTKAVVEAYDLYKPVSAVMERWNAKVAGVPPADAPFHEGAIKYLKEIGVWKAEHDKWNEKGLARMKKLQAAFKATVAAAEKEKVADDKFADFWMARREAALKQ
jgi:TRAP transporter TAXI family solute receptor